MSAQEKRKLDDFLNMLSTDVKQAKELQQLYDKQEPMFNLYQGRICALEQVIAKLTFIRVSAI